MPFAATPFVSGSGADGAASARKLVGRIAREFFLLDPSDVLAFQADYFGAPTEAAWTVLIQGLAREVVAPVEMERCRALRLPARGVASENARFARLATTRLTGLRFAALAA